ncbi:hypothetical protein [Thalassospira alkalitolerans]|tara:strand:+ start:9551 stop:10264 length:714 start_codon:yes stop_codon:yes gene_type:complete
MPQSLKEQMKLLRVGFFFFLVAVFVGQVFAAKASSVCLRIAFPEIIGNSDVARGAEIYRQDMAEAGLCIEPVMMPLSRSVLETNHGSVDGIFGWTEDLVSLVNVPLLRSSIPVIEVPVLLITRDPSVRRIKDLKDQVLGIWLGFDWAKKVSDGHKNTVEIPGGPIMMQKMLFAGRIDAMLVDGYSYSHMLDLSDYAATVLKNNKVYSWLREEHRSQLTAFNAGIHLYRKRFGDAVSN